MENGYIENGLEKAKSTTYSASLCRTISEVLSILVFLTGCLVLIGWIFDIPVIKSISPHICIPNGVIFLNLGSYKL
jgi:hypothetical protein